MLLKWAEMRIQLCIWSAASSETNIFYMLTTWLNSNFLCYIFYSPKFIYMLSYTRGVDEKVFKSYKLKLFNLALVNEHKRRVCWMRFFSCLKISTQKEFKCNRARKIFHFIFQLINEKNVHVIILWRQKENEKFFITKNWKLSVQK